ncbi:(2Fe-2S)-binding protein [Symbioplanes lichenis]|uniref:(2Fe-2S)-binding protein n=1 Tax=Symbioplanes lichenis TaxID=1629072 RepID=UPI002739DB3C|nr:(2Fe-2S)-binding protein [Actinoplanes lichenis]
MSIRIEVDGQPVEAEEGQTIAGVLLSQGRVSWRRSAKTGKARGIFCGIGVCFDCLVVVNGLRDVRACQRRAADGDRVDFQEAAAGDRGESQEAAAGDQSGNRFQGSDVDA